MYFNLGKGFTICFTVMLCVFSPTSAIAKAIDQKNDIEVNVVHFTAQPEQCVTLRQGRKCFANIQLQWQAPEKQAVCLFQEGQQEKIRCWQHHDRGELLLEFESNESVNYQLRTLNDNKVIMQTQVKVSWVHKSSARKRRWRLF